MDSTVHYTNVGAHSRVSLIFKRLVSPRYLQNTMQSLRSEFKALRLIDTNELLLLTGPMPGVLRKQSNREYPPTLHSE